MIPGSIFGIPVNLSNNSGRSALRSVAMSGSTVLVAWQNNDGTPDTPDNEIYVATSTDGGASFGTPVNVSNNAKKSVAPSVAISGSTALVAWQNNDGTSDTPDNEIYVARI